MKRTLLVLFLPVLCLLSGSAQGDLIIKGNTVKQAGPGYLVIKDGDFINNGTFVASSGTVKMTGTTSDTVGGSSQTAFYGFEIAKTVPAKLTLQQHDTVTNQLTLTSGKFDLTTFNLTVPQGGSVAGGDAATYIVTPGTGVLNVFFQVGPVTFPVGNSTYNPAILSNNGTGDLYGLRVLDDVFRFGLTGPLLDKKHVNRTWDVTELVSGGSDLTLTLQWDPAQEQPEFDRQDNTIMHFLNGAWNFGNYGPAAGSDPYTQMRSGITELSPFVVTSQRASEAACADNLIVTLNDSCQYKLLADLVISGQPALGMRVIVNDSDPTNLDTIDCAGAYRYLVVDDKNAAVCWGTVTAEDKTGPMPKDTIGYGFTNNGYGDTIFCNAFDLNQIVNVAASGFVKDFQPVPGGSRIPKHDYFLGQVMFEDNCQAGKCDCQVSVKFNDEVEYLQCNPNDPTYARITRRYTATDCHGNSTVVTFKIAVVTPLLDSIDVRNIADDQFNTCEFSEAQFTEELKKAKYKHFFREFWFDNQDDGDCDSVIDGADLKSRTQKWEVEKTCNYSAELVLESVFPICENTGQKREYIWKIFNWCQGGIVWRDTFLLKGGDFEAPILKDNNGVDTLSTGPMDCTAAFHSSLPALRQFFGYEILDCRDPQISIRIQTFGDTIIYGIPINNKKWRDRNYPMVGNMVTGVPVGRHRMIIEAHDLCYNSAVDTFEFYVKDMVAPVMKCDDQLNVTLTQGLEGYDGYGKPVYEGYARVDVTDVDEGSWDNCGMEQMVVRRSVKPECLDQFVNKGYTDPRGLNAANLAKTYIDINGNGRQEEWELPWVWDAAKGVWMTPTNTFVEFFCCDIAEKVVLELHGWDNGRKIDPNTGAPDMMSPWRNHNYCWLNIVIEDKSEPRIAAPATATVECTEDLVTDLLARLDGIKSGNGREITDPKDIAALNDRFGAPVLTDIQCANGTITQYLRGALDHCNFGTLERVFVVSKTNDKATVTDVAVQQLQVIEKFDYSICFPADAKATCAEPTIGTVTYDERGCDLLAVSSEDETFVATQDSACYKIFRTYRVINWCEYDGKDVPVIVERDWNAKAGTKQAAEWSYQGAKGSENHVTDNENVNLGTPGAGICLTVAVERRIEGWDPGAPITKLPGGKWLNGTVWYDNDQNPLNGYYWYVHEEDNAWSDPNVGGNNSDDDHQTRYGSFGFWQYTQHIVVYDDVKPEVTITADSTVICSFDNLSCDENVQLTINARDLCVGVTQGEELPQRDYDAVEIVNIRIQGPENRIVDGNNPDITHPDDSTWSYTFNNLPFGNYKATVRVTDGCGNFNEASFDFEVKDCKAPAPICLNGLTIALMPTEPGTDADGDGDEDRAAMAIWASDFIASKIYDCTGTGAETDDLGRKLVDRYYIARYNEFDPNDPQTGLVLTCDDAGKTIFVDIIAMDGMGNWDICQTYINVQDGDKCVQAASAAIAGVITTDQGVEIEQVDVQLSGYQFMLYQTDTEGSYRFSGLEQGHDYSVYPQLDRNYLNGVSTYDLVLMQKHIIGLAPLNTPYKLIAADVNNSRSITTLDMIELRKLILNIDLAYNNNASWRFVDSRYRFHDPSRPWRESYPEVININDLVDNVNQANFIGVKIGDISGNAVANSLQGRDRKISGRWEVEIPETELKAGVEYRIPFRASMADMEGYQFTLKLDQGGVELVDIEAGLSNEDHFGVFASDGLLTTSWNALGQAALTAEEAVLLTLVVRAKTDGLLSEQIRLNSRLTPAEAYDRNGKLLDVVLVTTGAEAMNAGFELYQNVPNPFNGETRIAFSLPEAADATITIQDINGRTVRVIEGAFARGYNELWVKKNDLGAAGVYYYLLETDGFQARKKMILVD